MFAHKSWKDREREGATRWPLTLYIGVFKSYPSCSGVMENETRRWQQHRCFKNEKKKKKIKSKKKRKEIKFKWNESRNHKCALLLKFQWHKLYTKLVLHTLPLSAFGFFLGLFPPLSIHFLDTRQTNKKQDPFIFSLLAQKPPQSCALSQIKYIFPKKEEEDIKRMTTCHYTKENNNISLQPYIIPL